MGIKQEDVAKALDELEDRLDKASEDDLDQPEGSDLGSGNSDNKMSDEVSSDKSDKKKNSKKSLTEGDNEMDKISISKAMEVLEEAGYSLTNGEDTAKSFTESAPEEITAKIEVSDFLRSLVDHTGDSIDSLRDVLLKSHEVQEERYEDLGKSVEEIQQNQAKIGIVLKGICERIGIVENAPAREPKAVTDVNKSEGNGAAPRTFETSGLGQAEEPMFKSLSPNPIIAKSQISTALCDLVKKGEASDMDVIGFEGNGHISMEVATKLKQILN